MDEDGFGPVLNARVTVITDDGTRQMREVRPHMSYLTSSDPRVHFGLGQRAAIARLIVDWPDGRSEEWGPQDIDGVLVLRRGSGVARPPG